MDNSFFVVLPSNTPSNVHINTSSHYKVDLIKPLNLPGNNWEVCLHEISFVNSWNNIHSRINNIILMGYKQSKKRPNFSSITELFDHVLAETDAEDFPREFSEPLSPQLNLIILPKKKRRKRTYEMHIPPGRYNTIDLILDNMNKVKPNWFISNFRRIKSGLQKVQFELNMYADSLTFNPVIAQILGFKNCHYFFGMTPDDLVVPGDTIEYRNPGNKIIDFDRNVQLSESDRCIITGALQPEIRACFYNLFVYTNIVRDSYVGDTLTPLLRTVQNTSPKDAYITQSFLHNIYIPVKTNYIPTIEILLADDTGHNIAFEYGKTIVTLHFRKRQPILLE